MNRASSNVKQPVSVDGRLILKCSIVKVIRSLVWVVATLVVLGTIANLVIYQVAPHPEHKLARLMHRFDLGLEPSLPALYSSFALLSCAVLLGVIVVAKRREADPWTLSWAGLSVLFVLLAIDESIMIHEMLHNTLTDMWQPTGVFYFPWVIPGLVFVTLLAIVYLRFLWQLEPRTRGLFLLAGFTFVSGAIGMEMVAGVVVEAHGVESIRHTMVQSFEEGLEMLGVVVFLYSLLDYIERHIGTIELQLA